MLFDLSNRTQLELTGADRAKFLHGFCTNDIKGLTPGRGCEAFVCNIQGKALGHIFVFCTESSLWIDSVPGQEDALFAHLDRYLINEDVQIQRRSGDYADYYLDGSSAVTTLNAVGWTAAAGLIEQPVLSHVSIPVRGSVIQIRLVDWLGEPGWLTSSPRNITPLDALHEPSADVSEWNARRIDAGFPLFGVDFTCENLAQEVGRTARCISFTKGCYLGQEPIARIDALGHVNRELHSLTIRGTDIPAPGTPLIDPQTGTQVGVITSAAKSAKTPDRIVALGLVRTKFCAAGSQLVIQTPAGDVLVTVG